MDDIEIRKLAREILAEYPKGITAGKLTELAGAENFNAVLKAIQGLIQERRHGGCENCGHCDCEL